MFPTPGVELTQTDDGGYWITVGAGTPWETKCWVSSMHLVDDHTRHLKAKYQQKATQSLNNAPN